MLFLMQETVADKGEHLDFMEFGEFIRVSGKEFWSFWV